MKNQDLSKQHEIIRKAIVELQEDIYDEDEVRKNKLLISLRIGNLSGILLIHLQHEDMFLYPKLIEHPDDTISGLARKFHQEMGDLSAQFEDYQQRYLKNPEELVKNTGTFITETEQMLYKISKRVEREEFELYPLLTQAELS